MAFYYVQVHMSETLEDRDERSPGRLAIKVMPLQGFCRLANTVVITILSHLSSQHAPVPGTCPRATALTFTTRLHSLDGQLPYQPGSCA